MDRVKKESKDDGTALYEQLLPSLRFKKGDEQLTIENRPSSFSSRAMDPPPTDPTRSPFGGPPLILSVFFRLLFPP